MDEASLTEAERAERWELLMGHRERLVALVRPRCSDPAEAEDCVHDAFVTVARMPTVDRKTLGALLSVIAVRRAVDTHRHYKRQAQVYTRLLADDPPSPEDVVCDRQLAQALAGRARTLSLAERRALNGKVEGFKPRETAERYAVAAKSVHLALSRARSALAVIPAAVLAWVARVRNRATSGAAQWEALAPLASSFAAAAILPFFAAGAASAPMYLEPTARFESVLSAGHPPSPIAIATIGSTHASPSAASAGAVRSKLGPPPSSGGQQLTVPLPGPPGGSVGLDRRNANQTFYQSVEQCLHQGLSVDPHNPGCRP